MQKFLKIFDPYIGLMLTTVTFAAIFPAHGIGSHIAGTAADAGIIFLFFLYGARLSPQAAISGVMQWKLQIAVLLCTFALFPLLGLGLSHLASNTLPAPLVIGIVFLCVLPSTVQSSIAFTSIARGNVAAALCAASASNILGVFLSPVLASWLLGTTGFKLDVSVFQDITLQLLAPFVAGQLLRPLIGTFIQRNKRWLGYADRGAILLIIYVAFSKGVVDNVWREVSVTDLLILIFILMLLLTMVILLTGLIGRRLMSMPVEDEIVLQFCGSKKSLASGLPIATVLFSGPILSLVVVPLIIFHQIQLIACAILARMYASRPNEQQTAGEPDSNR